MKQFYITLMLMLAVCTTAISETVTVWSGTQSGNLDFAVNDDNWTALMGTASGQGNLSAGDKINIYYENAVEGDKLWIQNSSWDSYSNAIIGVTTDLLTAGSGVYTITASQDFIDGVRTGGLKLRRAGTKSFCFTKVEVEKSGTSSDDDSPTKPTTESYVIWEGSQSSTLKLLPESDLYNKLVGDADGQANLSNGDVIKFYYTGAAEGDQVWFQDNEWNNITAIDNSSPTIVAGDSCYEFTVNTDAVAAIKEKGIMLRRPSSASYTFTKVIVIKAKVDENVKVPGDEETIVWSGSATGDVSVDFRYNPNKTKLENALVVDGYLNVYLSDVEDSDKIFIKETGNWSYLNDGKTIMSAGTQIYSMKLTQDIVDKIKANGMIIQRHDQSNIYDFEIRYVTISKNNVITEEATISNAGWATYVTKNAVSFPEGVTAYTVTYDAKVDKITLKPVSSVPANTAVVLKAVAGTYTLTNVESATAQVTI